MKAYELPAKLRADGTLDFPETFIKQLPSNQIIRIILLVREPSDNEEDTSWAGVTSEQFLSGYHGTDSIYDRKEK